MELVLISYPQIFCGWWAIYGLLWAGPNWAGLDIYRLEWAFGLAEPLDENFIESLTKQYKIAVAD